MPEGERRTLKEWRELVYFESQAEFAKRLGVDDSALSLWERGLRRPRYVSLRNIAEKLHIQPWQIVLVESPKDDSLAA